MNVRELLNSRRIANMFGAVGYTMLIISYAVVAGTVIVWLVKGGYRSPEITSQGTIVESIIVEPEVGATSILVSTLAYMVTILMLITVLFVTVTLPYWLGKSGSRILRQALTWLQVPITPTRLLIGKLVANALVVFPILLIVAQDIANVMTLVFVLALIAFTTVLFSLQHYLAWMNHLQAKDIL